MTNTAACKVTSACIEWTGLIQPNGYGRLHISNSAIGAHRLAWSLANGRAPKRGMDICHSCDNRKCINPDHLFEGTRSENMQDAAKKNRIYAPNKGKKVCIRGHGFTEENTKVRDNGRRECKQCRKLYDKRPR
jgi:hypothetical protein